MKTFSSMYQLDVDPRRDDDASPMLYWFLLKPIWAIFSVLWHKSKLKFNFNLFWKKIKFLGFQVVVATRKDLSIDVSITNVGLILTKLRWFQFYSTSQNRSQNSISNFFEKKNQVFGCPCCSTSEDHSIDVSITNVGLISTKPGRFLFSGYGQTDTVLESSHGNMSAHKIISTQSSKLVVSRRSLYASREDGDA